MATYQMILVALSSPLPQQVQPGVHRGERVLASCPPPETMASWTLQRAPCLLDHYPLARWVGET